MISIFGGKKIKELIKDIDSLEDEISELIILNERLRSEATRAVNDAARVKLEYEQIHRRVKENEAELQDEARKQEEKLSDAERSLHQQGLDLANAEETIDRLTKRNELLEREWAESRKQVTDLQDEVKNGQVWLSNLGAANEFYLRMQGKVLDALALLEAASQHGQDLHHAINELCCN